MVHTIFLWRGFLYSSVCTEKKNYVSINHHISASLGYSDTTSQLEEESETEYLCIFFIVPAEFEGVDIVE